MRTGLAIAAAAASLLFQQKAPAVHLSPAESLLADVRSALGGDARLQAIKSLSMTSADRSLLVSLGRTAPDGPPRFVTDRCEISVVFPDRYVERCKLPLTTQSHGFSGTTLLNHSIADGTAVNVGERYPPDMIEVERINLAHVMLWLLVRTDSAAPVTFRGRAEDSLLFRDLEGTDLTMEVDPITNLPSRLRFIARMRSLKGGYTGETASMVLEINDYRPVGDLYLPFHCTFMRNGSLYAERQILALEINPTIPDDMFVR